MLSSKHMPLVARLIFIGISFASLSSCERQSRIPEQDTHYATRMWYKKPSVNWNDALPVGNGRMGAMIYGRVRTELIQLNEQTLWSGAPRNWNNPNAKRYLPLVREAAFRGDYRRADSLSKFMQGPWTESYMPMADLIIQYSNISDSSAYERSLDLDSAISCVQFINGEEKHKRETLASFPDQVIAVRHSANKKGAITFRAELRSKLRFTMHRVADNHIILKGKAPRHVEPAYLWKLPPDVAVQYAESQKGEGMNFEVHLLIKNESGKISADSTGISVENADATTIIISAATSFNGFDKSPGFEGKDPSIDASRYLGSAATKSWKELKKAHIDDYQPIFRRMALNLGESQNKDLPTDERLKLMKTYPDPELIAMIHQFGRYVLIAGSRPGGQPVNLKGIWNAKLRPEYSSNWCIDHDAQMFYYPVETNNLSEMHEPFLRLIDELAQNGKVTASVNYGMRGWCAHHNTDIWRTSAPVGGWGEGNPHWATWNMSGPWLSAHLYDHYLFTGDESFLRNKAWPVMKGAAEFCIDWLQEDKNGNLISVPSVSPENTFITENGDTAQISVSTTSDMALMRELFKNCIATTEILKIDGGFGLVLKKLLDKFPPYGVGSKGQLLEWSHEWRSMDPAHRHLSHMYPVFPGSEISPSKTPQLSDAAKRALTLRTKTNCSWGFAWKAGCWARLSEGDSAWNTLQYQLQYVDPQIKSSDNTTYGLFPNLFNSEGQNTIMNGNGCTTAVITEMLIQSHAGEINFLPALPALFPSGTMNGICTRGGFDVDMIWENRTLKNAVIHSKLGNACTIRISVPIKVSDENGEVGLKKIEENVYAFPTTKNKKFLIEPI